MLTIQGIWLLFLTLSTYIYISLSIDRIFRCIFLVMIWFKRVSKRLMLCIFWSSQVFAYAVFCCGWTLVDLAQQSKHRTKEIDKQCGWEKKAKRRSSMLWWSCTYKSHTIPPFIRALYGWRPWNGFAVLPGFICVTFARSFLFAPSPSNHATAAL